MVKHKQFVCNTFPLKCEKMYVIVSIQTTWSYSASNPIRKILAWIRKADRLNFSKPLYKPSLESAERVLPCPMKKLFCRNSRFIEHLWMLFERNSFLASASNRFSSEQPLWKIVYLPEGHLIWNPFFVKLQSSTLLFNTERTLSLMFSREFFEIPIKTLKKSRTASNSVFMLPQSVWYHCF